MSKAEQPGLEDLAKTNVVRFEDLTPKTMINDPSIPLEVRDLIASRTILQPVNSTNLSPGSTGGGVENQDFSVSYVICPPGTGPELHSHHKTVETFTCLAGTFRFFWGAEGEHETTLEQYDVFVVPPGAPRAFRNISDADGMLQVLITGGIHDRHDISFSDKTRRAIMAHGKEYVAKYEEMGFTFEGPRE